MRVALYASIVSAYAVTPALAQPVAYEVKVNPMLREGRVVGCGIEYAATIRDHTYKAGAMAGVIGSVSLIQVQAGREPGMMFKLHGGDFGPAGFKPFAVAQANILTGSATVAQGLPMDCENPLGRCSAHTGNEWLKIAERMIKQQRLTVSYARTPQGLGVLVDIPIDNSTLQTMFECIDMLPR